MAQHLTSIHDLDAEAIRRLLDEAAGMEAGLRSQFQRLDGRIVCAAFFEPSTRTRLSFEAAAHRLGSDVIGFSDPATTSSAKGETLEDTVRMLAGYADCIVMRHPQQGAAARAKAVSTVPIVNAGDGPGEHPTQALLDLFTMRKHKPLGGLKVALVGDLKFGRTVHSLVPALLKVGAKPVSVAAPGLELPAELAARAPASSLEEAAASCDVLYVTRIQKERFAAAATTFPSDASAFRVDAGLLQRTGSRAIVMHPLPRVDEIDASVDALPAAKYFDQARGGVPVRMAVLASLLEGSA